MSLMWNTVRVNRRTAGAVSQTFTRLFSARQSLGDRYFDGQRSPNTHHEAATPSKGFDNKLPSTATTLGAIRPGYESPHPTATRQSVDADADTINPLSPNVFDRLPRTLQNMTIYGKTVLVTGGARGLGNNMARACAEAGAQRIILFDANQELGETSAAELHEKTSLPISFYRVDVRDEVAINAAVDAIVQEHGAPDVLLHAAGIADSNLKAETYNPAMFRRLIDINLNGSFLVSQAIGRAMIAAGKPGSIVLVASMSGVVVNYPQEQSCYNASKAGVIQLAKSLAVEWAKFNIRVNSISPGYMDTELNRVPALEAQKKIWRSLTPQNRLGNVDELNGLCVFLASDASSFMTGSNCLIDGGYSCL